MRFFCGWAINITVQYEYCTCVEKNFFRTHKYEMVLPIHILILYTINLFSSSLNASDDAVTPANFHSHQTLFHKIHLIITDIFAKNTQKMHRYKLVKIFHCEVLCYFKHALIFKITITHLFIIYRFSVCNHQENNYWKKLRLSLSS